MDRATRQCGQEKSGRVCHINLVTHPLLLQLNMFAKCFECRKYMPDIPCWFGDDSQLCIVNPSCMQENTLLLSVQGIVRTTRGVKTRQTSMITFQTDIVPMMQESDNQVTFSRWLLLNWCSSSKLAFNHLVLHVPMATIINLRKQSKSKLLHFVDFLTAISSFDAHN